MTCYIVRMVQAISCCIFIHIYNPPYLTIDIINDISVSQLQTKGMGEGVISLIYYSLVMYNKTVGQVGSAQEEK